MWLLAVLALSDSTSFVRVNQVGYLPDAPKVAVVCSLVPAKVSSFLVRDDHGRTVAGPSAATSHGSFGPCAATHRLDFTQVRAAGRYRLVAIVHDSGVAIARDVASREFRIGRDVFAGGADTLLYYLRQQRSGWNPLFKDSVHTHDGNLVDDSGRVVKFVNVSGGWADASDYLQYVTTTATATYMMLAAYRDHPQAFGDAFDARGLAGRNGVPDVVDEVRHGLDWLSRMFPNDTEMYNQLGDDRDHTYFDLIVNDSADYGWGRGRERALYACTGRPQGLFQNKNRSTGYASTAGKYASAFALAAMTFSGQPAYAAMLRHKALAAFDLGDRYPGVCQTAPAVSPYFYEEENWTDDMELAATQIYALTAESQFLAAAVRFARAEPVTPWMGADTARHYEWFPWHNNGHRELAVSAQRIVKSASNTIARRDASGWRDMVARFYGDGLNRVVARANNGFRVGIPFIWCSNNLMTSFATQALYYRELTGDTRYREYEQAAIDWLFGVNPWGVSMVIGYPGDGTSARDPHSVHASRLGVSVLLGGLLDGPVYRSIYGNLKGIRLVNDDEYARFNTGFIVYHDDLGDYSTNEPIMDGTASLVYLLSALAPR
ncbi:MAG TPA: glycoside hydrolase family 9 protein [Gemmatimonadaceae bacterium]|nr:glycoside hydrolase family 9 protein [Gemmatimonadaceae bacterium]